MMSKFAAAMREAVLSTRAQNPVDATRIIQAALGGGRAATPPGLDAKLPPPFTPPGSFGAGTPARRDRRPLGDVVSLLKKGRRHFDLPRPRPPAPPGVCDGAEFVRRSYACPAGTREYKLYIPPSPRPRGLIVMLHGCTQGADDFATGTNMNAVAEAHGFLVAYPEQPRTANANGCWNWFRMGDQQRGAGEPAIIAGITRSVIMEFDVDRDCVFVAGLSAGGAMAAVIGEAYPDLFAAIGVHSGLAVGSARDVVSAFAAMQGEASAKARQSSVRTIIFHGGADQTVHPRNAGQIFGGSGIETVEIAGAKGRTFTRTISAESNSRPGAELWIIDGAGHAWSGGCAAGSYADPKGPDASAEMVRFFLNTPRDQHGV